MAFFPNRTNKYLTMKDILRPQVQPSQFSGKALVLRGVHYKGQCLARGTVHPCTEGEFRFLSEGRRVVEYDPENKEHVALTERAKAAAAPAPASPAQALPPSAPRRERR